MNRPSRPGTKWRRYRAAAHAAVFRDSLEAASLWPWRRVAGVIEWPPRGAFDAITMMMPTGPVRFVAHPMMAEGTMLVMSEHVTMAHGQVESTSAAVVDALLVEVNNGRRPSLALVPLLTWVALNSETALLRRYDTSYSR